VRSTVAGDHPESDDFVDLVGSDLGLPTVLKVHVHSAVLELHEVLVFIDGLEHAVSRLAVQYEGDFLGTSNSDTDSFRVDDFRFTEEVFKFLALDRLGTDLREYRSGKEEKNDGVQRES
jgi:hypothetical protein